MKADILKDLRELKGRVEVIKGWGHEGDGRRYILDETVWEDAKFPTEALEIANYP